MTNTSELLEEFFSFLETGSLTPNTANDQKLKDFESGFKLLKQGTSNFKKITISCIAEIIAVNPSKFSEIILVLRIPLAISRMMLETYFISFLCTKKFFMIKENQNQSGISYYYNNKELKATDRKYENLIKLAKDNKIILKELITFFWQAGLKNSLKQYSGQSEDSIFELTKSLLVYSEKGAQAAYRGKEAENIIKNKLLRWGLKKNVHFNHPSDVKLRKILTDKITSLESNKKINSTTSKLQQKKIEQLYMKREREYDLVFPPIGEPKLITQIVYYTSNTGSEGKKKKQQNQEANRNIKKILKSHESELKRPYILDGPGWIDMVSELQENDYLSSGTLIGINSVDTRLKKMLNEIGFVYPIDVDIAILELEQLSEKPTMKAVLEKMATKDHLNTRKEEIRKQNCAYFENKSDNDIIEKTLVPKITKQFLVLEKIMYCDTESNDATAFYLVGSKVQLPSPSAVKDELKKLNFKDDEIDHYIEKLESEGTLKTLSRNNS